MNTHTDRWIEVQGQPHLQAWEKAGEGRHCAYEAVIQPWS